MTEGVTDMVDGAELGTCLVDYYQARSAAMTAARLHLGIGELDARALLVISERPGIRPTALREHLGVTSAAVTILLDRLVVRGAVRRDPDPRDRRAHRIFLVVDLDAAPWDELGRFDRAVVAAAVALPSTENRTALHAVDAVLAATHSAQS